MQAEERARLIAKYRDGYKAVAEALQGISDEDLDRAPEAEWSPRKIVHHLANAEIIGATRLRRLLADDHPLIQGYDEGTFAARLPMDRPLEPSLQAIRWTRESTADLLDRMTEADWDIVGTHSERGPYGPMDWLRVYAAHAHDHAEQIRRTRGAK